MPCELIYTRSRKLLRQSCWARLLSWQAKYGVVAESPGTPPVLERTMISLSKFANVAGRDASEPQYKYYIDFAEGHVWHILSCVRLVSNMWADKGTHVLAHHIAFTENELQKMWRRSKQITPADVMMYLTEQGFWVEDWQKEPCWIESPCDLNISPWVLPESAWAALTGRTDNKYAFCREPYTRACLVVLPTGTSLSTILNMLKESDLCLPDMGWGHAFYTHGAISHVPGAEARVFTVENSALVTKALRAKHPILTVSDQLNIPPEKPEEESELLTTPPAAPVPVAAAALQRPPSTNFAPLNLATKTQQIRKDGFVMRALRHIGRALLTLLRDIKDFVFSFVLGFVSVALIAGIVLGLGWLIVMYLIPFLKTL